jgi:Rrf2 family protein
MLGKTTLLAIRTLIHLSREGQGASLSPKRIAEVLGESPTYLSKVTRLLVKAGILRADRGVKGGVRMNRTPDQITLLSVVEACQGAIVGDFCQGERHAPARCAFHEAALELHEAIKGALGRWLLSQLLERSEAQIEEGEGSDCVMKSRIVAAPVRVVSLTSGT